MKIIKELVFRIRGEYTTDKLTRMGLHVGTHFLRMRGAILDPSHCWLLDIGDYVTLAPRVHILCHDTSTKDLLGYTKVGRVTIGNHVFIGAESVVLPGVEIGDYVIVGAGSVVSKNIPSNSVVAGNPAVIIAQYDDYMKKHKKKMEIGPVFGESYTLRNKHITDKEKEEMRALLADNKIGYIE